MLAESDRSTGPHSQTVGLHTPQHFETWVVLSFESTWHTNGVRTHFKVVVEYLLGAVGRLGPFRTGNNPSPGMLVLVDRR